MKGKSKFDYGNFYGDTDVFAVSKQRYSLTEALKLYRQENEPAHGTRVKVEDGFAIWRAGVNESGEKVVGWWLESEERERSCPIWVISVANPVIDAKSHTIYAL